jgi:hypothetical protein
LVGVDTCEILWILVWYRALVSDGKPRLGSRIPVVCRHYQPLPSARIKPKQSNILDSIRDITAGIVDTQSGGPEGRSRHKPSGMAYCSKPRAPSNHHARWGPATLTPRPTAIAPAKAYDPEYSIEASYFGKDFLRMAGIVQMLHLRIQSNDT